MVGRTVRIALVAVTAVTVPAASARACRLFERCCGPATTAYYAPVVAAYAPAPVCCPQQQVVSYMPQTCYRTVYVNQPVVTYQPATACDACGRATTVMRPVTTFVAQPRLVPYTTYRTVAMPAQPCCATPAPVAQAYCAPAVQTVPAPAPAQPCCGGGSATYTPAPSLSNYSPAPVTSTITTNAPAMPTATPITTPVTPAPSTTPYPAPAAPGGDGKTFVEPSPSDAAPAESRMLLPPRSSSFSAQPSGLDSDLEDRTTAIPLRSSTIRQASLVVPAKAEPRQPTAGGWRAAADR
jgi:hypothetical protein